MGHNKEMLDMILTDMQPRFTPTIGDMTAEGTLKGMRLEAKRRCAAVLDSQADAPFCLVPLDDCGGNEALALAKATLIATLLERANAIQEIMPTRRA